MSQTIAEKIISAHCGKNVKQGQIVIADVDFAIAQDGTAPLAINVFETMEQKKIFSPEKIAFFIDHSAPSPSKEVSTLHKSMRDFALKQNINFYDIGAGVCHVVTVEKGHIKPGSLAVGADSHTCSYGALNAFATGIGSTDFAAVMASGKIWLRVPESIQIVLSGKIPSGVYAKDIVLYLMRKITAQGAVYKSIEFRGEVISALSVESRFTIANMAVEMGAKSGLMEVDEKTKNWLHGKIKDAIEPVYADSDAVYLKTVEYDISDITPQIACPHSVDNTCPIENVEGTAIQQAFIGTCTNGRLEDLRIAASVLKGKKINPGVRLIIAPASRRIYLDALREHIIVDLVEAGATMVTPGCGCCVGTHSGIPADGENVISTANRNFKGRMGNSNAFIYLASPATVAASAIEGKIADPRKYIRGV